MFLSTAYNNAKRWVSNKISIVVKFFIAVLVLAVVVGCVCFPLAAPFAVIISSIGMTATLSIGVVALVAAAVYGSIIVDCTIGDSSERVREIKRFIKDTEARQDLSDSQKAAIIRDATLIVDSEGNKKDPQSDPFMDAVVDTSTDMITRPVKGVTQSILQAISSSFGFLLLPIGLGLGAYLVTRNL